MGSPTSGPLVRCRSGPGNPIVRIYYEMWCPSKELVEKIVSKVMKDVLVWPGGSQSP
jgi:hypothetical protein